VQLAVLDAHLGDGAGGSSHSHGNAGSFEGRSRRSAGTQQPFAVSQDDFSVSSQIDQQAQRLAFMKLGSNYSGKNVTANKASWFQNLSPDPVKLGSAVPGERCLKNSGGELSNLSSRDNHISSVHRGSAQNTK
jgi:hypothetical protein